MHDVRLGAAKAGRRGVIRAWCHAFVIFGKAESICAEAKQRLYDVKIREFVNNRAIPWFVVTLFHVPHRQGRNGEISREMPCLCNWKFHFCFENFTACVACGYRRSLTLWIIIPACWAWVDDLIPAKGNSSSDAQEEEYGRIFLDRDFNINARICRSFIYKKTFFWKSLPVIL